MRFVRNQEFRYVVHGARILPERRSLPDLSGRTANPTRILSTTAIYSTAIGAETRAFVNRV